MVVRHTPVLVAEMLAALQVRESGTYVDCTVGEGGHALAIVSRLGPEGTLIGIDRDRRALEVAAIRLRGFPARVRLVHGDYRHLERILADLTDLVDRKGIADREDPANPQDLIGQEGPERLEGRLVDGILFDLGLSSLQLEERERGFSYQEDVPLDMRFDPEAGGTTAADLVNGLPEAELVRIIAGYGEERWAVRIARFIVAARERAAIATTAQLVRIIKEAVPAAARRRGPHPARRTFQALRIAVNDELGAVESGIRQAVQVVRAGGRICVISYHSLEDRIAKRVFQDLSRTCHCPPGLPVCRCGGRKVVALVNRKPIRPADEEVRLNPRGRSARLRAVEKL